MHLLRRTPEFPEVYEKPLAYSIDFEGGTLHVTKEADEAYELTLADDAQVRKDIPSLAANLTAKQRIEEPPYYDALIASPDELPNPQLIDERPYYHEVEAPYKDRVFGAMSMENAEVAHLSTEMHLNEFRKSLAESHGVGIEEIELSFVALDGKEYDSNIHKTLEDARKAMKVGSFVACMVAETYADWQRDQYTARVFKSVRQQLYLGFAAASLPAGFSVAATPDVHWLPTAPLAFAALPIGAGVIQGYQVMKKGFGSMSELTKTWSRAEAGKATTAGRSVVENFANGSLITG
jgi:hypothetical protein